MTCRFQDRMRARPRTARGSAQGIRRWDRSCPQGPASPQFPRHRTWRGIGDGAATGRRSAARVSSSLRRFR